MEKSPLSGAFVVLTPLAGQAVTSRQGLEMDVRLDNNEGRISVDQEVNPRESFAPGDRLLMVTGGGRTRVTR